MVLQALVMAIDMYAVLQWRVVAFFLVEEHCNHLALLLWGLISFCWSWSRKESCQKEGSIGVNCQDADAFFILVGEKKMASN